MAGWVKCRIEIEGQFWSEDADERPTDDDLPDLMGDEVTYPGTFEMVNWECTGFEKDEED